MPKKAKLSNLPQKLKDLGVRCNRLFLHAHSKEAEIPPKNQSAKGPELQEE